MNIVEQDNLDLKKLCDLIKDDQFCMLTNADDHGNLVSRPMAPLEMTSNGAIWFLTNINSVKSKHIDNLNLTFSNESRGTYVSISGMAEISDDRQRIRQLWSPAAKPWFPDGPESPDITLLVFRPNIAEYWDSPHSKVIRVLAMAASIVAGKPIGLGEHETLKDLNQV